jgi:hypothetical protein
MKGSLLAVAITGAVVISGGAMVATATATDPPAIPNLPKLPTIKPDASARFSLTAIGNQSDKERFTRVPEADGCTLQSEGTLDELWTYARGKGVTIEFEKIGHQIYVQRVGRQLGDTAFATTGEVSRDATGFVYLKSGPSCVSYPLPDPICGQSRKAPLDLAISYAGGKLKLKGSGPSQSKPNPMNLCGIFPAGGTSFNQLTHPFPFLAEQSAKLSAKQIFKSHKGFKLHAKTHFIEPADLNGYTTFSENMSGETDFTFKRL